MLLFAGGQFAAVGCAVRFHLLIDSLLLVLQLGGFTGSQLPALDALSDAVLLVFLPLAHFAVAGVGGVGVVFVGVDLLGQLILLPVDLRLFCAGQLAAVGRAVRFGFAVDGRFLGFQFGSFTGGQLAALHALGDAVLLIFLALRNGRLRRRSWCRRWGRCRS